jgi:hypothetical protein
MSKDTFNSVGISIRTQLQQFVVIDERDFAQDNPLSVALIVSKDSCNIDAA